MFTTNLLLPICKLINIHEGIMNVDNESFISSS